MNFIDGYQSITEAIVKRFFLLALSSYLKLWAGTLDQIELVSFSYVS
jgi:hypothetical protein